MSGRSVIHRFALVLPLIVAASTFPVVTVPRQGHVAVQKLALHAPGALRAPASFGLVGVSWPAGDVRPQTVRVRTSVDGERWSEWNELEMPGVEGPDAGTAEAQTVGTSPLWVGRARYVDVRWTGRMPAQAKVAFVDPGPDPASPPASAQASPGRPGIITRAQWGADERIRKCCAQYAEPLRMLFIHHTASGNTYSAAESKAIVRSIYAYHVKSNGWNDIGYNFLVDKYGQIFEGRYGGMDRSLIGAHTLGFNSHSSGIAVIGTYDGAAPSSAAMTSLRRVAAWRLDRALVNPVGTTTMTSSGNPRHPAGRRVNLRTISAHRDVYPTGCPGNAFYAQLDPIRRGVRSYGDPKLYHPGRTLSHFTPNGDGVADSSRVTAHFSSPVSWSIDVLDSAGRKWMAATGSGTSAAATWNGRSGTTVAPHGAYRFVFNARNRNGSIRSLTLPVSVWHFPNGTLFRTPSGYAGILRTGRLGHVVAWRAAQSRYRDSEAIAVPDAVRSAYPAGPNIGFRDGSVVRVDTRTWIISDGVRRPVSEAVLSALGYNSSAVIATTMGALSPHPEGTPVTFTSGYPNGTALSSTDKREAIVQGGLARPFVSSNVRLSYAIRDVDLVGPADTEVAQAQGSPPVGFRDGSIVRLIGQSTTYVIADGLRRRVQSSQQFDAMGYNRANIRLVSATELALNPEGPPL